MRYVKNLKQIIKDTDKVRNLAHKNPIILFLSNKKDYKSTDYAEGEDFQFVFHLEASEEYANEGPLILGLYNGVFGTMDVDLDPESFVQKHFMDGALSNQLAIYLIQELLYCPGDDKWYLENMIVSLGDYLVKRVCQQEALCSTRKMGITPFQLQKIQRYILDHIDCQISTNELATLAKLSVHHFIRMFKRTTGETPHQFTNRLKMEHAKELLLGTEENIIQVGMGIGYDNPSHFSQLFKNSFGITPLKFRKAFRQSLLSA